jgi:eukaryotic-like serine/threonine-protein kinase
MNSHVILSVISGPCLGTTQIFDKPGTYSIGREEDQRDMALPDSPEHQNVSRHHCDFKITSLNPPNITILDKSVHGTFHNGRRINQETALADQDIFSLADIAIQITIINPTVSNQEPRQVFQAGKLLVPKVVEVIKNFLELSPPIPITPSSTEEPPPVTPLQFQDYELGEILGQGAFSKVYKATHRQSGKQVALKFLQADIAKQDEATQRFIREIDNTKVLDHPNVVKLLDFRYQQGAFFYTTEYCEAGSLFALMQSLGKKLPLAWAKLVIAQILNGLAYTHEVEVPYVQFPDGSSGKGKGLIHRNLKPENILLTNQQGRLVVKIGDFALSKPFGSAELTQAAGISPGTPFFMSRSQLFNYPIAQPEMDLWAAAACLYEMLTGYPPRDFGDQDPIEVIMNNDAVPILDRSPHLPIALAAVIDQALQEDKNYNTFYKTAQDLKRDLLAAW